MRGQSLKSTLRDYDEFLTESERKTAGDERLEFDREQFIRPAFVSTINSAGESTATGIDVKRFLSLSAATLIVCTTLNNRVLYFNIDCSVQMWLIIWSSTFLSCFKNYF